MHWFRADTVWILRENGFRDDGFLHRNCEGTQPLRFLSYNSSGRSSGFCRFLNLKIEMEQEVFWGMTFETVFAQAKEQIMKLDAGKGKEHLAYQFQITGESSGKFYIEIRDGRLSVEPYEYNDRDALFICDAQTLMDVVSGKMGMTKALSSGRLRAEGNIGQALKLQQIWEKSEK